MDELEKDAMEGVGAAKAILYRKDALKNTEYFNRKLRSIHPSEILTAEIDGPDGKGTKPVFGLVSLLDISRITHSGSLVKDGERNLDTYNKLKEDGVLEDSVNRRIFINDDGIAALRYEPDNVILVVRHDPQVPTKLLVQFVDVVSPADCRVNVMARFDPSDLVSGTVEYRCHRDHVPDMEKLENSLKYLVGYLLDPDRIIRKTSPQIPGSFPGAIPYGNLQDPFNVMPPYPIDEMVNLPRMIIQDIAPFAYVNEPEHVPETMNIPYPKILFELGEGDERNLVVVERVTHMEVLIHLIMEVDTHHPFMTGGVVRVRHNGNDQPLDIQSEPFEDGYTRDESIDLAKFIIGFIAEFQVGNTIITTPGKVNRSDAPTARTGRKFRIVRMVMGVKTIRKPWQGGTHASPREHQRIGHWRTLRNGKRQWFPETTVNKGVPGKIDKVYLVSKKTDGQPS
ncbi:hypothetical protein D3C85_15290 [compost metagenome]